MHQTVKTLFRLFFAVVIFLITIAAISIAGIALLKAGGFLLVL